MPHIQTGWALRNKYDPTHDRDGTRQAHGHICPRHQMVVLGHSLHLNWHAGAATRHWEMVGMKMYARASTWWHGTWQVCQPCWDMKCVQTGMQWKPCSAGTWQVGTLCFVLPRELWDIAGLQQQTLGGRLGYSRCVNRDAQRRVCLCSHGPALGHDRYKQAFLQTPRDGAGTRQEGIGMPALPSGSSGPSRNEKRAPGGGAGTQPAHNQAYPHCCMVVVVDTVDIQACLHHHVAVLGHSRRANKHARDTRW